MSWKVSTAKITKTAAIAATFLLAASSTVVTYGTLAWEINSLIGLMASGAASVACFLLVARLKPGTRPALAARLAFILCYGFTLLLALRFGARTYPGIWVRESAWLNDIFNGSYLFFRGYETTLAVMALDTMVTVLRASGRVEMIALLNAIKWVGLSFVLLVVTYGFFFAVVLERTPD